VTAVFPSTAADEEQQFVTVTLSVDLPSGYPDVSPVLRLRNPRGLDDDLLAKIMTEAKAKCEDYVGQPVIYELIEVIFSAFFF
jgi:E3 ubiquitin-protein ligase RNF25